MTAPHIRRRQQQAAAKINAEAQATATDAGESVPVPSMDPENLPESSRSMWHERHISMRYGYEINESETGWHVVLLEDEQGDGMGFIGVGGGKFELSDDGYCEAAAIGFNYLNSHCGEAHPMAESEVDLQFRNEGNQPGDSDPLAGLGLRAGDLEAVRDQVISIMRPLQREHYRAMFMAAVIQGRIAAGKEHHPESLAHSAIGYADAACRELGL